MTISPHRKQRKLTWILKMTKAVVITYHLNGEVLQVISECMYALSSTVDHLLHLQDLPAEEEHQHRYVHHHDLGQVRTTSRRA